MIEELIKKEVLSDEVYYEIYSGGNGKFIVVDYFNGEVNGESIPLMKCEIDNYLKNSGLV